MCWWSLRGPPTLECCSSWPFSFLFGRRETSDFANLLFIASPPLPPPPIPSQFIRPGALSPYSTLSFCYKYLESSTTPISHCLSRLSQVRQSPAPPHSHLNLQPDRYRTTDKSTLTSASTTCSAVTPCAPSSDPRVLLRTSLLFLRSGSFSLPRRKTAH